MKTNKVKACMVGESVFKVGDYASIAQGWSLYKDVLSIEEFVNLKIINISVVYDEEENLPKFTALVETNKGNIAEIDVLDLNDVRNNRENREELNKVGYDFEEGAIYSKGYESLDGKWSFINIGMSKALMTA